MLSHLGSSLILAVLGKAQVAFQISATERKEFSLKKSIYIIFHDINILAGCCSYKFAFLEIRQNTSLPVWKCRSSTGNDFTRGIRHVQCGNQIFQPEVTSYRKHDTSCRIIVCPRVSYEFQKSHTVLLYIADVHEKMSQTLRIAFAYHFRVLSRPLLKPISQRL